LGRKVEPSRKWKAEKPLRKAESRAVDLPRPYEIDQRLALVGAQENVSVFELQSIQIIDCKLSIWLIESKYLKMTKAIWIIEF
jgi:hypothetical protein